MKYTEDDLKKMGYRKVGENKRGDLYEDLYGKKRIVMKKDEEGKYIWWGLW